MGSYVVGISQERRSARRYPFEVDISYLLHDAVNVPHWGLGRTVNLSSSGLLFRCDCAVPINGKIELAVVWPCSRKNGPGTSLKAKGLVVRSAQDTIAVAFVQHAFVAVAAPD